MFLLLYSQNVESRVPAIAPIKTIPLERSQTSWGPVDLESLIAEDHPARTIWNLCGQFDLSGFEEQCKTREGEAGRPCFSAQLLVSVWVYSYTLGVASARAIERMIGHEPGFRWLTADNVINYHTLANFRVGHKEALQEVFAQFLALLETAGMVDLNRLLHDGTKVRAVAGRSSLHRRKTVEKRLKEARRVVRELDRKAESESEGLDEKRRAAQRRVAQEGLQRAKAALEKLKKLEAKAKPSEQKKLRVSESEPDAGNMKHPDGGWGPSYNVQVSTEAKSRIIVGVGVSTAANDIHELMPALEKVKENCGALPKQVIADNGYATRSNVEQTSEQNVELIAPWKEDAAREAGACATNGIPAEFAPSEFRAQRGGKKLTCPAGKTLVVIGQKKHHGQMHDVFEARQIDCGQCPSRQECCGARGVPRRIERVVESAAMKQYLGRMKRPEVKQLYRKRSEIAEFPHLWSKAVKKWRRFSVRGVVKAEVEAMWVALAYNVSQWMRIQATATANL
jgi:transposase